MAKANLRDAPGSKGKVIATLRQQTKLSVQAEENGWCFVQTEDQMAGWISKSLTGADYKVSGKSVGAASQEVEGGSSSVYW